MSKKVINWKQIILEMPDEFSVRQLAFDAQQLHPWISGLWARNQAAHICKMGVRSGKLERIAPGRLKKADRREHIRSAPDVGGERGKHPALRDFAR